MIDKSLDQISVTDLQDLVDNKIIENRTLEYKSYFPSNPQQKNNILAEIVSFANTMGGDLILGITEGKNDKKGVPIRVSGVNPEGTDDEMKQKLNNFIKNSIRPLLIPFPEIRPVKLTNGKKIAFVIRVQRSWMPPHKLQINNKFYIRTSSGKEPMDVPALRIAFTSSGRVIDRIREFRVERIGRLLSDDAPIPLTKADQNNGQVVLHLVPLSAMVEVGKLYDVRLSHVNPKSPMNLLKQISGTESYNLDGILKIKYSSYPSYVQFFRTGMLEYVNGEFILDGDDKIKRLINNKYEKKVVDEIVEGLEFLKEVGVRLPVFIFLTLLNMKGCVMTYKPWHELSLDVGSEWTTVPECDRHIISLPEKMIKDFGADPTEIMSPLFDIVYNACRLDSEWRQRGG